MNGEATARFLRSKHRRLRRLGEGEPGSLTRLLGIKTTAEDHGRETLRNQGGSLAASEALGRLHGQLQAPQSHGGLEKLLNKSREPYHANF